MTGSDEPKFGSRPNFPKSEISGDFHVRWLGECNGRMYIYKYYCSSPSIRQSSNSIPDEPLFIYIFFLSRQSAWNKASFQNLLIPSSYDFVPSFLASNYHSCGKYEEHNHKPNTIVVTAPEASRLHSLTIGYINTKSDGYVQENSVGCRWQMQGLQAEFGLPFCFIQPGTLCLPGGSAELSLSC